VKTIVVRKSVGRKTVRVQVPFSLFCETNEAGRSRLVLYASLAGFNSQVSYFLNCFLRRRIKNENLLYWRHTFFFHQKILIFEPSRLLLGETMDAHNWEIVKRWNSVVNQEDIVYHLGDVAFKLGSKEGELKNIIYNLNGHKKLIMGNHDTKDKQFYLDLGFEEVFEEDILVDGIWLSHKPILDQNKLNGKINIHGHVHSNSHRDEDTPTKNLHLYINASIEVLPDFKPMLFKN